MSRKWLPWMVLVTGISHLWDALRASFPEDSGPRVEYTPPRVLDRANFSNPSLLSIPIGIKIDRSEREMKNEMIHDNSQIYRLISSIVAQRWENDRAL